MRLALPPISVALLGLLVTAAASAQPASPGGRTFAVLIGIDAYRDRGQAGVRFADKDAELFMQHLRSERGGSVDVRQIRLLTAPGPPRISIKPTREEILSQLTYILHQEAGPDDTVYIFISARARAPLESEEVYISALDSPADKNPRQYEIPISEFRSILDGSVAGQILLFIDVCRGPLEGSPNRINLKLAKAQADGRAGVLGLLASGSNNWSLDDPSLAGGHGVFAFFLVWALEGLLEPGIISRKADRDGDGLVTFAELSEFLRSEVPAFTGKRPLKPKVIQTPDSVVNRGNSNVPLSNTTRAGTFRNVVEFRFPEGILLASTGRPQAGALAPRDVASAELDPQAQDRLRALSNALSSNNLLGAGGAVEVLEQLAKVLDPKEKRWQAERDRVIRALLDVGQQVIARYGTGDRLTTDPNWAAAQNQKPDFDRAAAALSKAIDLMPADAPERKLVQARYQFALGRSLMLSGAGGEREFSKAVELAPEFAEAHNALGVLQFQESQFDTAAQNFEEAIRQAPDWAYPRHNLALTYIERGLYADAVREYRDAIRRAPYYAYLDYNLAVLLQRLNRLTEAKAYYEGAIQKFKDGADEFARRAKGWRDAGDASEAALAENQARLLRRNLGEAYTGLGTLVEPESRTLAMKYYQNALDVYPGLLPAAHDLALLYQSQGDLTNAERLLSSNLAADPTFLPSKLSLAGVYLQQASFAKAEPLFRELTDAIPENISAALGLAQALAGQGQMDAARSELARIEKVQTASRSKGSLMGLASPEIYYAKGNLLAKIGQEADACRTFALARRAFKDALEDEPTLELRKEVRDKMRGCKSER
jgi:tetratricopeptide (TPR) repeat protein